MLSLGVRVDIIRSSYEEMPIAGVTPRELAVAHARGKAAGADPSDQLIVAADTVVDVDGAALGKPRDSHESRTMIERLAGRSHEVHSAFALRDDMSGRTIVHCQTTRVRVHELDPETIAAYVASGDGLDKAGAYGIQGFGATLIERIDGDYFTVVGFPIAAFARTLPQLGYRLEPPAGANWSATRDSVEVPA